MKHRWPNHELQRTRRNEAPTQLRRAALNDMASVARIHRLAFSHAMPCMSVLHTPDDDLTWFSTVVFPSAEVWLCEQAGIPAGFIAFRSGWVDHLYVRPENQGCGIGSALLALAQSSQSSVRLWTFLCNLGARRFYEQRGFRIEQETDGANNEQRQPDILYLWSSDSIPSHRASNAMTAAINAGNHPTTATAIAQPFSTPQPPPPSSGRSAT